MSSKREENMGKTLMGCRSRLLYQWIKVIVDAGYVLAAGVVMLGAVSSKRSKSIRCQTEDRTDFSGNRIIGYDILY
jgi:hypothetical protein